MILHVRLAAAAATCLLLGASAPTPPPGALSSAILRGLEYVYRSSLDAAHFREQSSDYMWCFFTVAHTARDPVVAAAALRMGRERAATWHRQHRTVPPRASADDVLELVAGAYVADRLGIPDERLRSQLRVAARRYSADAYLHFNPKIEPPPSDIPDCDGCTSGAQMRSRYDMFLDALIATYFGDAYGVRLGASYRDVIRWLPRLRPYVASPRDDLVDVFYAATHVVYTQNSYGEKRVSVRVLPQEFAFIRRALPAAIAAQDPELVGKAIDTMKAFGYGEREPLIRRGMAYLIASQHRDGGWSTSRDYYTRYHSAWTAIDALRDYRFGTEVRQLTEVPGA